MFYTKSLGLLWEIPLVSFERPIGKEDQSTMRGPTGDFLILLVFYDKTYWRFYQKTSFFQVLPELYRNSADFRSIEELLIVYHINCFSITRRRTIGLLSEDRIDPSKSSVWKSVGLLSKNQQVSHCSFAEYLLIFPSKKIAVFIQIFYQRTYWIAISKAHWSPTKYAIGPKSEDIQDFFSKTYRYYIQNWPNNRKSSSTIVWRV